MRVALLVSPQSFESFYGEMLGLDRRSFVEEYRNDFVWDYAAALRDEGIELMPYVPSIQYSGADVAADGYRVRFLPMPRPAQACVPVIRHALTPVERYAAEAANAALFLPALRAGLREDGADVLYVQEYWTGRFDLLAHRSPIPFVAGEHGGSEGRHVGLFKRGSLKRAAGITCQSTAEQQRLRGYGIEPVLVPNGVDDGFYTPPPATADRERTILLVARLHDAQKRISDVLRALAQLPDTWRLELVGSGPDEQSLRNLAAELGVADRTTFAGFVADKNDLRERYRRCGVFALPSEWEGMTIALLEAMSCGMPAVVTPLRPFADLVDDGVNGLLVPHQDPAALAEAIQAAYARREQIGPAARGTVERCYSRRATIGALAELLRSAVAEPDGADGHPINEDTALAARARALPGIGRLVDSEPVARLAAARRLGRHVRPNYAFAARHLRDTPSTDVYTLRGTDVSVVIRHGRESTDVATLAEFFEAGIYDPPEPVARKLAALDRPPRVVDLGANIGLFGAFVLTRLPSASMTAFEPDPANLEVLNRCVALNGRQGAWEVVEACAASSDGELEFAAWGHSGSHAIDPSSGEVGVTVPKRDAFPWIEAADLLKIDIEGGEWELLRDPRMAQGPMSIVLEYHPHLCPSDDPFTSATELLTAAGYEWSPIYRGADGHGMLWAWRAA